MRKHNVAMIAIMGMITHALVCVCKEHGTKVDNITGAEKSGETKISIEGGSQQKEKDAKENAEMKEKTAEGAEEKKFETKENKVETKEVVEAVEDEFVDAVALCNDEQGILFVDTKLEEAEEEELRKLDVEVRVSSDKKMAEKYNVPYPGLYYKKEGKEYTREISANFETTPVLKQVTQIIAQNDIPLFREITEQNYMEYESTGLLTAYVVADKKQIDNFAWMSESAKAFRNRINIALLDYAGTQFFLNNMGISAQMVPCMLILTEKEKGIEKYVLRDMKDNETVNTFVKGFLDGTVERFWMEETVSDEESKRALKKVVRSNYKKVVMNPEQDTLVMYHAGWCNYCKEMMPHMEKVAELLQKNNVTSVVVAEMHMAANDLPEDVQIKPVTAYPTIRMYKKGTNMEVELSNAGKTKPEDSESILEFVRLNAEIPESVSFRVPEDIKVDL